MTEEKAEVKEEPKEEVKILDDLKKSNSELEIELNKREQLLAKLKLGGKTDFAEAPICITAFFMWALLKHQFPSSELLIPLTIGAMVGGSLGPCALSQFKSNKMVTTVIGWMAMILGILCALNVIGG